MSIAASVQDRIRFPSIFAGSLALCFSTVQALLSGLWEPPPEPPPIEVEASAAIAVPPKPEGARPAEDGDGTGVGAWTEARCRQLDGDLRDVCFHQLARGRAATDLPGALEACGILDSDSLADECRSDVAELHAPTDRDASLGVCPTIQTQKWADQCVFGIALARRPIEPRAAFRLCDDAGRWYDMCRHDVNGEISVVDDALAFEHCLAEEGDVLTRKTCWHGIGKYVARVDVARAWRLCADVPPGPEGLYRDNCVHGLAWGAAETLGRDMLSQCGTLPGLEDPCKLGVAYFESRFDTPGAVEICETVDREPLRAKCLDHVRRMSGG